MNPTSTLTPESVLAATRARHAAAMKAEIDKLQLAVEWVLLHPGDEVDTSVEWHMRDLEIAGDGAPTIDEGAVAEFALAIGVSTDSGRSYLGDAVELCYRLPRIWKQLVAGQVPVWKARRVASATMSLSLDAAGFVDRALAPVVGKCSFAQIDRTVEAARAEFDPAETERRRVAALETRKLDVDLAHVTFDGLVHIEGDVDVADAVAFDTYLSTKAATLDPELPLDVRRAMAVGLIGDDSAAGGISREVVIYTHTRPGHTMVEVENTRSVITPEHLLEWCRQAGTRITVRPVIDLAEELSTASYTPTPLLAEQVRLRHPTCVFPGCTRPSRGCDLDHVVEWPIGRTTTINLAPLCRMHHRLKTHTAWCYIPIGDVTAPIGFEWVSPLGERHTR